MGNACLEYTCPSHGGWGMVRTGMLVPESYQLFVCPSACGRHGALGAVKQGFKKRLCYFYLEESDIISGYENAILEAVEELFERLGFQPNVLFIFVSCLDDLIGTDGDAVLKALSQRYPLVQVRMCHMNPISGDSEEPPQKGIWKNMYSLLMREEKRKQGGSSVLKKRVNLIGNLLPVDPDSELHSFLEALGMEGVDQVASCHTYEEFRDMGNHCLNLQLAPFADRAVKLLKQKEGMEYIETFVSYDFEEIEKNYQAILQKLKALGIKIEETQIANANQILLEAKEKAEQAVEETRAEIGSQKLFLDYSAFVRPLKAARFLLEHGFEVAGVYLKEEQEEDPDYQWIRENSSAALIRVNGPQMLYSWKQKGEGIAIGAEAAYAAGSSHAVILFQDEGMYGYHAVIRLMEMLRSALEEEIDLETTIHQLGLVV